MIVATPDHWSAQQLDALLELLFALEAASWNTYEPPLVVLAARPTVESTPCDEPLDDHSMPF